MLYLVLKLILRIGLWVFFRKFEVRNRHMMPERGPLLVVANHPNTFMDPIVIASLLRQQVYFIAKSTAFDSRFKKWLLHRMNLIPIHRREDMPDQPVNNEETFRASNQALAARKTLLIFPEGNSFNERRLRKIKTGAARMALGAAADTGAAAGLKILPVGLNYSAPTRFRSNVFVNVGRPIEVAAFLERYRENPATAVTELTELIRQQLEKLIVVTPTNAEDEFVRQIERIYKDRLAAQEAIAAPGHIQDFLLTRAIVKSLAHFINIQPQRVDLIKEKILAFDRQLNQLGLRQLPSGKESESMFWQGITTALLLVVGLPLHLYGLVNNYLPYIIPSKVADALTEEKEFRAPIMLSVGVFSFPIFYGIQAVLFWQLLPQQVYLFLYLLSLPLTGFFTLRYWDALKNAHGQWLLMRLFLRKNPAVERLRQQRQEIVEDLDRARADYLQRQHSS